MEFGRPGAFPGMAIKHIHKKGVISISSCFPDTFPDNNWKFCLVLAVFGNDVRTFSARARVWQSFDQFLFATYP
jgi:hypothetical protein